MNTRQWWHATLVLVVAAAGCFTAAIRGAVDASDGPPTPSSIAGVLVPESLRTPQPEVARSTPVALRIPAIHVDVSLSRLGLNPDGTVEVPTDYQQPGWFRLGPTPGQVGSAVILGHVDSYRGPAVFFRLGDLRKGDRVSVTLADGVVTRFVVDAVAMYPKLRFPAHKVYGSHHASALQLVTCGGAFDRDSGHYLSNVVVYTSLVASTP